MPVDKNNIETHMVVKMLVKDNLLEVWELQNREIRPRHRTQALIKSIWSLTQQMPVINTLITINETHRLYPSRMTSTIIITMILCQREKENNKM